MLRLWHLAVFAAVPLALVMTLWLSKTPPNTSATIYGFDTGSGKLFATDDGVPPFAAPSGYEAGALAHAVIFDGDAQPTVVYLITYTAEAHAQAKRPGGDATAIAAGMLVRRVEETDWTPANTPAGRAIRDRVAELAAGRAWRLAIP